MVKAKILWIEGNRAESPHFIPGLRKEGYSVETVTTGDEATSLLKLFKEVCGFFLRNSSIYGDEVISRLISGGPALVVVNAASLRSSGKRICRNLRKMVDTLPIVVLVNRESEYQGGNDPCASISLTLPFTLRKLINRIEQLLPWEDEQMFVQGHVFLDELHRRVRCEDREARLTPRLVQLLRILMEHPGEVIERERLFREVWKTEYTADTRALDVHISWLREAIEENPRQPKFLKTIRGVGYRLDV